MGATTFSDNKTASLPSLNNDNVIMTRPDNTTNAAVIARDFCTSYFSASTLTANDSDAEVTVNEQTSPGRQETLDQQAHRAYLEICQQICDGKLDTTSTGLTIARIRHLCAITELAAIRCQTMLCEANVISPHPKKMWPDSKNRAKAILERAHHTAPSNAALVPAQNLSGPIPPWLNMGEIINFNALLAPDDRLEQKILSNRQHPATISPPNSESSWCNLRLKLAYLCSPDFTASDVSVREDFVAAWEELKSDELPTRISSEKIFLAMAMLGGVFLDKNQGVFYFDYLVTRYGLLQAFHLFLEATCELQAELHQVPESHPLYYSPYGTPRFLHLTRTITQSWQNEDVMIGNALEHIRDHLSAASLAEYQACLLAAQNKVASVPIARLVGLAYIFCDSSEFSQQVWQVIKAGRHTDHPQLPWLLLNIDDWASIEDILQNKDIDLTYFTVWTEKRVVLSLLYRHRHRAWFILARATHIAVCMDGLLCIGLPEVAQILARDSKNSKDALYRFKQYCERWPAATLAALGQILATSSKEHHILHPSLMKLVRQYPELTQACTTYLDSGSARILNHALSHLTSTVEMATAADLPEALQYTPWLQQKKCKPVVLNIKPLVLPACEQWNEQARHQALQLTTWEKNHYAKIVHQAESWITSLSLRMPDTQWIAEYEQVRQAILVEDSSILITSWRAARERLQHIFFQTQQLLRNESIDFIEAELQYNRSRYPDDLDGVALTYLPASLGIPFWNAVAGNIRVSHVNYLVASWGVEALPGLLSKILVSPHHYFHLIEHFGSTELAMNAAHAFAKSKNLRKLGRNWLLKFPEHAICGLLPVALGKKNEARDCAASALRLLAQQGQNNLLMAVAERYQDKNVALALQAMLNENPLDRYPAKRPSLPEFWQPADWQRPQLLNGKALDDQALTNLGTMMMFPTNEEIYPGLLQVKAACEPKSLAQFCWDAFSAWLNSGAAGKDNWVLTHLGLFGDDDIARRLTPLIRAWPGESAHARAVTGLNVLTQIGSDTALMLLNGIAQKVKFKGLQDNAREKIQEIAASRGLTQEELEDRLAPDLGLDEKGSLILDFGPRAFKVGFDECLKPYVREWQDGKTGAKLSDLPKPKKSDDEELAKAAVERFKLLKKDARTIASQQVLRLEVAMCQRRRWSHSVFQEFIAQHPLVAHLARRLIWAVYEMPEVVNPETDEISIANYGGKLISCFRVSEEGSYTNAHDEDFDLPSDRQYKVGLPHALELPLEIAGEFAQLFADYELLQPFAQLGRDTYRLDEGEKLSDKLLRWSKVTVPTGKVLGLVNIGWRRGPAQDGGCIWTFEKPLGNNQVIELTLEPGIIVGMIDEYPEQTLGEITLGEPQRWGYNQNLVKLGELDEIAASELIRDMERMRT